MALIRVEAVNPSLATDKHVEWIDPSAVINVAAVPINHPGMVQQEGTKITQSDGSHIFVRQSVDAIATTINDARKGWSDVPTKRRNRMEGENEAAFRVMREATAEPESVNDEALAPEPKKPEKNPAAVALGRLGGKKGGLARAKKLSAKRRSEIAKKAARVRWG